MRVGVDVAVAVGVTVRELLGVFVGVLVGVLVGVSVGVLVGVFVGVSVGVLVGVSVGVFVGVSVGVLVGVSVGVLVGVSVGVLVGVSVGVAVTNGPALRLRGVTTPSPTGMRTIAYTAERKSNGLVGRVPLLIVSANTTKPPARQCEAESTGCAAHSERIAIARRSL